MGITHCDFFMWVMIREVGRYTVISGKTILDGYRDLPGPRNWAIWLIFIPQIFAAVVTIAGIAALAGSTLMIALPGNQALYASALIILSAILVVSGHYKKVEQATSVMAVVLVVSVVAAAIQVFPDIDEFTGGLVPGLGDDFDIEFLLPWLGFILAGAAGIMWFSYWVAAREYGGSVDNGGNDNNEQTEEDGESSPYEDDQDFQKRRKSRLKKWFNLMSTTAAIGVVGGGLVIVAFMILGAELLRPEGVIPEGIAVAEDLTRLLSEIWGEFGYWLLTISVAIALGGTIIANQDGWPRMFADATMILKEQFYPQGENNDDYNNRFHSDQHLDQADHSGDQSNDQSRWRQLLTAWSSDREKLKNIYVIVTVTLLPLVVFFLVRDPVDILEVGGIVAAVHTPVVVGLTLYLNKTKLPREFQPQWMATPAMVLSGLFFTAVAILYFMIDFFGFEF